VRRAIRRALARHRFDVLLERTRLFVATHKGEPRFIPHPATPFQRPCPAGASAAFPAGRPFGVRTNQFGFTVTWASGLVIVVEACTNLAIPDWSPLQTNTLSSDSLYFSDPQWTNYPARFYRFRSP